MTDFCLFLAPLLSVPDVCGAAILDTKNCVLFAHGSILEAFELVCGTLHEMHIVSVSKSLPSICRARCFRWTRFDHYFPFTICCFSIPVASQASTGSIVLNSDVYRLVMHYDGMSLAVCGATGIITHATAFGTIVLMYRCVGDPCFFGLCQELPRRF